MQQFSNEMRMKGKTIGFVPTMGFLHDGHLSLLRQCKKNCDITIVSIFVNPTQFAQTEDLSNYPRDYDRDYNLLHEAGCDVLFLPDNKEIYPADFQTFVDVSNVTRILEGKSRPTHFKGVTTIVTILFNAVLPHKAYFGQKDAQQAVVIDQMAVDLKMNLEVIICPILREEDGLAMSSRNVYLNEVERKDALVLSKSLEKAKELISNGEGTVAIIISEMEKILTKVSSTNLDYVQIVEKKSFSPVTELRKGNSYFLLIACRIGKTRLIDNEIIEL